MTWLLFLAGTKLIDGPYCDAFDSYLLSFRLLASQVDENASRALIFAPSRRASFAFMLFLSPL